MRPVYVEPFLGAGAVWLALLDPELVPLVSWMGGKRRLARDILALLDLRPGRPVPAVLGDASWWGWVWPTVLDPVEGPRVSEVLRSWRGEDPRALWFRLRDLGPVEERAEAAAQLLWLQARAASGVPVWWEGGEVAAPGDGRTRQRAYERTPRLLQEASTQIDDAGQRQAKDPRLLASDGRGDPRPTGQRGDGTIRNPSLLCDHEPPSLARGGGIVDPGTIADRADAIRARLLGGDHGGGARDACAKGRSHEGHGGIVDPGTIAEPLVLHTDARALTEEWGPRLGAGGRWYFDGPYDGATGYPATCSRDEYLAIVEMPARNGAPVVVSEAVGLAADLGSGWTEVRLRGGAKEEWVTCWGCDVRAVLPPLLRRIA